MKENTVHYEHSRSRRGVACALSGDGAMKKGLHPFWFNISPWIILGTMLILIPMLTIMTLRGVEKPEILCYGTPSGEGRRYDPLF